jgi:uncharacterized protein
MSDQLPGGAPAFEEPDFSKFAGAEATEDVDVEDEFDDDDVDDVDDEDEGSVDAEVDDGADDEDLGDDELDDELDDDDEDDDEDEADVDANSAYAEDDGGGISDTGTSRQLEPDGNASEGGAGRAVLEHVARSIVDEKDSVVIETKQVRGQLRFYLHVAPGDMGRIIGRRGRTAQAVRTLVRAAAASEGQDIFVEIVD